jgi:WD40 repeat protein
MHNHTLPILCGLVFLLIFTVPVSGVTPLWTESNTAGGELSGVIISADDSTIIIGGDQLISLTRDGQKRWSGWSGTTLDISSQGDYILSSKGPIVRLISSAGTLVWERPMDIAVTDVSLAPDLSFVAGAGGGKVMTMTFAGEGIASNVTMAVNHLKIMPDGKHILVTTGSGARLLDLRLLSYWSDTNSTQDLLAVAPGGSSFVTATSNRVRMYTGNGSLLWDKRFSVGNARTLAWSRDGSTIVIGTDGNNVQVLNRYGTQLWMANATNWINSVAVSGDGNTIAAGSLDKKLYVYNHVGTLLGTFSARNAIRSNSVAVTSDGTLIVVVSETAAYGLLRTSFTEQETPQETITVPSPEPTDEMPVTTLPTTTARKVTRTATLPTPYPVESATPESPLAWSIPLGAVLALLLCRSGNK